MSRGRKLESLQDYQRALKNKYGIGSSSDYKPWLKVQDVKSNGNKSLIWGIKSQREHHMMSSIESELFYLAEFSDSVIDIREQFPLLPLNYTQKIAKMIGVEHPKHPKTKEPIIMTTDQLLTIESGEGISYQAISVKPESEFSDLRVLEKLDIERIFWELLGVKFSLFNGNKLTKTQSSNLSWASAPFRENPISFSCEQVYRALDVINIGECFYLELCENLISLNIVPHDDAQLLIRYLICNKIIDVDLSSYIPEVGVLDVKYKVSDIKAVINGL